jgi:hypothetical protein
MVLTSSFLPQLAYLINVGYKVTTFSWVLLSRPEWLALLKVADLIVINQQIKYFFDCWLICAF